MKIVRFSAANYKRLVAVEITPDGNTVLITGKNGEGKSSVLDGIVSTLQGKKYLPKKPIREGEDYAETVVETENYIIKRTYTASGGGSVTIKGQSEDGITLTAGSPQTLLDKIVGQIAFDPMLFIRMGETVAGEREQLATVMRLAKLDFSDIDAKIATAKSDRSDVRRVKEVYEHDAGRIIVAEGTPDEEVNLLVLNDELEAANEANLEREALAKETGRLTSLYAGSAQTRKGLEQSVADLEKTLKTARARVAEVEKSMEEIDAADVANKAALDKCVEVDVAPIRTSIATLEVTNAAVRNKKQKAALLEKAEAEAEKWRFLGKKMKNLDAQRSKRLACAKMPLEGMSVTEDGVVILDKKTKAWIPLSQINDAQKLKVGMGIAMAQNPELRVILMKGNDLDEDSLKVVSKMAEDKDYMLWIERIEGEGGIVIEDGSVKE